MITSPHSTKRARTRDQLLVSAQTLLMDAHVAALGLRRITDHAGLVHASFYTHFPDIGALVADLGELLGATHAAAVAGLVADLDDPARRFARVTRHTLRMIVQRPELGRLLFDAGLPADCLGRELRLHLRMDLALGAQRGVFTIADVDLATSMIAGAISGLALDLHRGTVAATAIDTATCQLLVLLGLDPRAAKQLGHEAIAFPPPPDWPMRWLALPAKPTGDLR